MARFRINYTRVLSQANDIEGMSSDLGHNVQKLDHLIGFIKTSWKGPASEAFLNQCEMLKEEMNRKSMEIERVSNTVKNVAHRIHEEDLEAAERAKRLASKKF
ncbi:WXG100 family type VII secretion target [Vallitalea okinawensis]|uniref:WXG100 family type VII secretion target n=1 Tax=Vallitalea okinawensis TaxID=2078660 RepID=UPI000CFE012D|nr:WXG100 family type VII secretion target [Vallitalea okinawensis]